MPPKKSNESGTGDVMLTAKNVAALCAGLRCLEGGKFPWKEVGAQPEVNIILASNAQRAFRDALKKMGHDMKDGRVYRLGDEEDAPASAQKAKATKANKNGDFKNGESGEDRAENVQESGKKRKKDAAIKAEEDIDDNAEDGDGSKKAKLEEAA